MPFGAVILPADGRVGDEVLQELLPPLRRALAAALIDLNPSRVVVGEDENPNAGHAMATAENGHVFGQPLTGGNHYVISLGGMLQMVELRSAEKGRRLPPVEPPVGLPTPFLGISLDEEYAAALYATLTAGDDTARRLDRCIQWLVLAWSNEQVVGQDARILAFRAAFDVLLGGGSQTRKHGHSLSGLLEDHTKQRPRSWTENGKKKNLPLNDTEWWFQSMSLLRNAIAHGDEVQPGQWLVDDGQHHVWHADDRLRRAIKETVIAAGQDPDLAIGPAERHLRRAYAELARDG